MNINFFISLFAAHLLSDFVFQTSKDVQQKSKPQIFTKHLLITTLIAYVLTGIVNMWLLIPLVFIVHGIIDLLKLSASEKFSNNGFLIFTFDQAAHIISLLLLTAVLNSYYSVPLWIEFFGKTYIIFLAGLSAIVLVTVAGGIAVGLFVKPFVEQMENEERGFINGGKVIGYLERFLILIFVTTSNIAGVGFLIAAKSVFRFGELFNSKNRKEAEYIIIGTFFSFAYALVVGFSLLTIFKLQLV